MNRKDKILKYIAGSLGEIEKAEFEKELDASEELRAEYEKVSDNLSAFKGMGTAEADSSYFARVLPEVRGKINKKQKSFSFFKPAFSVAGAAALILLYFMLSPSNENNLNNGGLFSEEELSELYVSLEENNFDGAGDLVTSDLLSFYDYDATDQTISDFDLTDEYNDLSFEDVEYENYEIPVIEESSIYDKISRENIEYIYEEIKNKNYF